MILKQILFSLFILVFFSSTIGQTRALDSLRKEVYSYSKEDTIKLRLIYEYHIAYDSQLNYDSMLYLQSKLEKLALKLNNKESMIKALV